MSLTERIDWDLTAAMKTGDTGKVAVLRLVKNSLKNEQIRLQHELADQEVQRVLQKEAKQRRDSIEAYQQAGRSELADAEAEELKQIESYLPEPLSDDELDQLTKAVIKEKGASDRSAMGQVIAEVVKRSGGRAEGSRVSQVVQRHLS